uniref:N-acetyltransferase domain-containing protein n=1 Tax=Arion vulgaris TaxID=1028688 RepID=A0A0B6ZA04_9EUPU
MLAVSTKFVSSVCLRSQQCAVYRLQLLYQQLRWSNSKSSLTKPSLIHTTAAPHLYNNTHQTSPNRLFDGNSDLHRFLIEVGTDPKEARYWLKNFMSSAESSEVFMVVSLNNDVMESHAQLETFASTISFLYRNGISPLIVCGSRADQPFKVTKDSCVWSAVKLSDLIEQHGMYTRVLYPGCGVVYGNDCDPTDISGLTVTTDLITRSLVTKHLPILLSFGETPRGQIFPVNPWDLTVQVSRIFQPKKVMLVNSVGGLTDEHGRVVANINLPFDLANLNQRSWCSPAIIETMAKINKLLIDLPFESSVVISSADTMLRELFSHRGSGTFFRATEAIHKYSSLKGIDLDRLRVLLNRSFMVEIQDTYFDDISDQIHAIYLSETYSGVAIVLRCEEQGVPYLCKFAVTNKAQGQGTGDLLWDTLTHSERSLFWRSRTINPINTWYFKKCEGSWNNEVWTVFWYGIEDPHLSSGLIEDAIGRKDSFKPRGVIGNIMSDDEEERIGG